VIRECSQLREMQLKRLYSVRGMCVKNLEQHSFFKSVMYGIISSVSSLNTKAHSWTIIFIYIYIYIYIYS